MRVRSSARSFARFAVSRGGVAPRLAPLALLLGMLGAPVGGCDAAEPGASANAGDLEPEARDRELADADAPPRADADAKNPVASEGRADGGDPPANAPAGTGDGDACTTAADCASGICEGQGCGPGGGRCAARERTCTADLVEYCGCDGQLFRSSGSCAKRRFAYRGACKDPLPAGSPCTSGEQCASGACTGEGLEGCDASSHGTCAAQPPMCTRDLRPYCGCDGHTFRSSGSCPGRSFRHRGECPAGE